MDGSDKSTREIEENYYGSVKELSIDNPLMKEAIEPDHAIKKLKSLQKGFRNEVANAARQLKLLPSETERLRQEVEKIRADISLRAPVPKGDEFLMVVNGKEYRERREAGQELIKVAKLLNEKARSSRKEVQKATGELRGISAFYSCQRDVGQPLRRSLCPREALRLWRRCSNRFGRGGIHTILASFDIQGHGEQTRLLREGPCK